jgi:hypothetical protein
MLSGKIKAELKLQDATGAELCFTDLDTTDVYLLVKSNG